MPRLDQVLLRNAARLKEDVQRRDSGETVLSHVPTGFKAIDATFGGLRLGVCTELMAHTGDGKSSFARQVAEAAARSGVGVLWFCGEDPEDATAERYLSDGTGVTAVEMGRLDLSPGELERIEQHARESAGWARHIEARFEAPTVEECLSALDETTSVGGAPLRLAVFDYAQIFGEEHNLESEIAKLAKGLNQRSGDRQLASLLLSQVSNRVLDRGRDEYRVTKDVRGFIPGKGDTEWCKRAEKSTKALWSLFRPGAWRREMGEEAEDNTAELHVKKANFGPTGFEVLGWDGPRTRFYDLE
jgi:replicative DNA helicase